MSIEERIKSLNLDIPSASPAGGSYVPVVQCGTLLFVAGQIPIKDGQIVYAGKVGGQRDLEFAANAAKMCINNLVAALRAHTGDLEKIKQAVKLQIFVNSEVGFMHQHLVGNAASEYLCEIFGEKGKHARTALGTNQLPLDVTVEIEGIFEVYA